MKGSRARLDYPHALREGSFLSRENRFLVCCRLGRSRVRAHLPNPGRLRELLLPGRKVLLAAAGGREKRRTAWTVAGVVRNGETVMLNTHYTNRAARWLLEKRLVPGLEDWEVARSEVPCGHSRFDFLLRRGNEEIYLEVKSCTLFAGSVAMFPDAVTERGRRHVIELASLGRKGARACVLFVVQSARARVFLPDYHTDPAFARALYEARKDLLIRAVGVRWNGRLALSGSARSLSLPWETYEREACGGGSYLLVLHLPRKRRITVGRLGTFTFDSGYYVYVGSAELNLYRRIERHRRGTGKKHWHVDYLRERAAVRETLPIQSAERLECALAESMAKIAAGPVPGFGSSDCRCATHLFYRREDPMGSEDFVDMVLSYRMGRLTDGGGRGEKEEA